MTRSEFRVVLDTNVLLVSLAPYFTHHWVFERLLAGDYELFVTNEILAEYQEQITKRYGLRNADARLDFLLLLPNVTLITPFYHWNLITDDPDDNKFLDCAVAANADFIVSNDKHFKVLSEVDFPRVKHITIAEFERFMVTG
jgi:putative PIN family toxin of toxin-antitoxin system